MGYGNTTASSANVDFNFDLALEAARDLHALSRKVSSHQIDRAAAARLARPDWEGQKRVSFDDKITNEGASASEVRGGLVTLANSFAAQWAQARGEQDRINFARYVDEETSNDSWGENAVEFVAGEDDYGEPPANPPVPGAPDYAATREPQYAEFENR